MTSLDEERVMMRSSKDDRSWCEPCLVGDFTNCEKEVEWRSSVNQTVQFAGRDDVTLL